jgi:hypothetical protein
METHFLLAFGEEEFFAALAMTGSEAFFNKLLGSARRMLDPSAKVNQQAEFRNRIVHGRRSESSFKTG